MKRALAASLALAATLAWIVAGLSIVRHEEARSRYEALAAHMGAPEYQRDASDAAYEAAARHRDAATLPSWLAALAAAGAVLAWTTRRTAPPPAAEPPSTRGRFVLAIDLVALAALLLAAHLIERALGIRHAALGGALHSALAAIGVASIVGLFAAGASPGARVARVHVEREDGNAPGVLRAIGALVLAAITLPLALASKQPGALRWMGLRARGAALSRTT